MERKMNWAAIAVCVVLGQLIGFLWYGQLFTDIWAAGNNITFEADKAFKNGVAMDMSPTPMIFNVFVTLAYALIIHWLLVRTNANTWMEGAKVSAVIGVLTVLGIFTGNMFAANPISLSFVDASYSFLMFVLFGAILGGWQKK